MSLESLRTDGNVLEGCRHGSGRGGISQRWRTRGRLAVDSRRGPDVPGDGYRASGTVGEDIFEILLNGLLSLKTGGENRENGLCGDGRIWDSDRELKGRCQ